MNPDPDTSEFRPVLLLDDGELDDVREILRTVTSEVLHLRGGMIPEVLEPPEKLFIATSRRAVVAGNWPTHSPGEGPVRVAVVTDDSNTLRSMLRRIGFDLLVRRPFHPYALRLLFLRALYSGDERRRETRAPIGAEITFRQGLRKRSAILADLSPKGCRLLSARNLPVGTRVTVQFPKELVGRKSIPMRAKVVRATNAKHENIENQWSLGMMFQDMTLEAKQQVQRILKGAVELSVVSEDVASTISSQSPEVEVALDSEISPADSSDEVFDGDELTSDSNIFAHEPNLFKAGQDESGIFSEDLSEAEADSPESDEVEESVEAEAADSSAPSAAPVGADAPPIKAAPLDASKPVLPRAARPGETTARLGEDREAEPTGAPREVHEPENRAGETTARFNTGPSDSDSMFEDDDIPEVSTSSPVEAGDPSTPASSHADEAPPVEPSATEAPGSTPAAVEAPMPRSLSDSMFEDDDEPSFEEAVATASRAGEDAFDDDDPPTPASTFDSMDDDDDPPTPVSSSWEQDDTPPGPLLGDDPSADYAIDEDEDPPTLPDEEIHGVPLAGAGSSEERRKQDRGQYEQNVVELGDIANRVLVGRDLSAGGMRVDAQEDLLEGMRLKIALYADAREEPFVVNALVVRNDGDAGVALQFQNLSGEVAARLEGLVADLPRVESLQDGEADNIGTIVSQILEGDLFDPIEEGR